MNAAEVSPLMTVICKFVSGCEGRYEGSIGSRENFVDHNSEWVRSCTDKEY
jgi:hypothetical protein